MTDDDLRAAAEKFAELDDDEQRQPEPPRPQLPSAREYLKAARWGFNHMVEQRVLEAAFVFHIVSVVTVARAVPIVLNARDRKRSAAHEAVIGEWWARSSPATTPVMHFLKRVRDIALHEGAPRLLAIRSSLRHGEGSNEEVISRDYEVDLIEDDGTHHDVLAKLREALDWLEAELAQIEARLPDD
jgi:hypothetical protein